MRTVKFKRWIPIERYQENNASKVVAGTGCFESSFANSGKFHQWGLEVEYAEETVASYTVGIIEDKYGIIHSVATHNFIFVEQEELDAKIVGQLEHTSKDKQEILDQFATAALTALIAKMPFYDSNAEHGQGIDIDKLQGIKKQLTRVAYEYAGWMMIARQENKEWLKKNEEVNPDFGS